jgi:glycerol-3-phosphate O-acyltransferase
MLSKAIRSYFNRTALRSVRERGSRVDKFKLAGKSSVHGMLMANPEIAHAAAAHGAAHGLSADKVWSQVEVYIDEIIPSFSILAYYRFGYVVSRSVLKFFYKVSAEHHPAWSGKPLPRDAIVIYLMNHRSNADYLLVGYVLSGKVAISYAVGEWARAFPLEYIFKSFGSYFIRRKYREPLYHTVLEQYVQLITREGVTQGIFPEGGLTRDGKLRPGKIGLLDYMLGVARDEDLRRRIYLVPVAINYDRVLEDRTLLRELARSEGGRETPRRKQLYEVSRYVWWNAARMVFRRWKRYGRAAVTVGEPLQIAQWFDALQTSGTNLFELSRQHRLAEVQALCDQMMSRIGAIIPVTPVPLACAAIQSLDSDFVPRERLLGRMSEMRDVLLELNARVIRAEGGIDEIFDRAWKMLRMRKILVRSGDGYVVLPKNRGLISYYANSIAHLLGPFEQGVRERDALPSSRIVT